MHLMVSYFFSFLTLLIMQILILIGVAFMALAERKILSSSMLRVGPNYSGYFGIFQSFADALKLFVKEFFYPNKGTLMIYFLSPFFSLFLVLILWLLIPIKGTGLFFLFSMFFFVCLTGVSVYPLLSAGWSSNCKYSMLGSLRGVAQMVSYEISLVTIILSVCLLSESFNIKLISKTQNFVSNFYLMMGLCLIFFISLLAETNRTPYDFSEGESELVSGFNTEYSSGGFTLIFMAEYASIMFMSCFFTTIFFGWFSLVSGCLFMFMFVWIRATVPRYRYDKLMNLAWKTFLPVSLCFFIYFLGIFYLN